MAKKLDVDIEQLEALAAKGYTVTMICEAVGITRQAAYKNRYIIDAIKRGNAAARQKVIDDLMARSEADQSSTAAIYLSKKLKVFNDPFPTSTPKSAEDATKKISNIYKAVAAGTLDEEKGTHLVGYLEKFIKAHEVTQLEKRIEKLEEASHGKQ